MTLSDISIKNTVFAWILMFGLIIFGAIGFSRMGISQMPDVDFPVITVTVTWVGASPETMESSIADVLEDSVMTIEGIRNISSTSMEGLTNITIEFELSRDVDGAGGDGTGDQGGGPGRTRSGRPRRRGGPGHVLPGGP
ncbi:MAG TPA: efflux RND transporter permease subunit, partial [Spirochaetota bacterium]|nr:efflux RND transporter permease subunit [Spirochaetota bacterium]